MKEQEPTTRGPEPTSGHRRQQALSAYRKAGGLTGGAPGRQSRLNEEFARHHQPIVESEVRRAKRRLPATLDLEDMYQEASIGFLAALERFDDDQSATFPAFARLRVRGAIMDWLRRQGRPAPGAGVALELPRVHRDLCRSLRRAPTEDELSSALGIDSHRLLQIMESASPAAYNPVESEQLSKDPVSSDAASSELADRLAGALQGLPQLERRILELHYFDELSVREIADVLAVGKSSVARRHQKALLDLRGTLADYGATGGPVEPLLLLSLLALSLLG